MTFFRFLGGAARLIVKGNKAYYAWCAFLLTLILIGGWTYLKEFLSEHSEANMNDSVSWAFFIGNYTFLVGVAAAAVVLVIPAYIYHWQPIKEIVILGELLAISAVIMVFGFVMVDLGHPERFWHMLPMVGTLNFPFAILSWGIMAFNIYLMLNIVIVTYLLYKMYMDQTPNKKILWPLVIISIPLAISIHTVTACIYNGMIARPYWNASILAPRFLASAFCSGPAIIAILLQILRRTTRLKIQDAAIWKIAELMAYAMAFNLFLTGVEVFKEYYSGGEHLVYTQYFWSGVGGHHTLVPYAWMSVLFSVTAFVLFLIPATRRNVITLNIGCVLIYFGVYIEKGVGLLIPGQTPDTLGEIYEYFPSRTEVMVTAGIFSVGFLLYTIMVKVAVPVMLGEFRHGAPPNNSVSAVP